MIMNEVFTLEKNVLFSNGLIHHLDLRVAAELGRHLLERNQDLQNYISILEKQLDDTQYDMKVRSINERLDISLSLSSYCIQNIFRLAKNWI